MFAFNRLFQASVSSLSRFAVPTVAQSFRPTPNLSQSLIVCRSMNRNARIPKAANHGKRPCSHARRRAKAQTMRSRAYKTKLFGFWY